MPGFVYEDLTRALAIQGYRVAVESAEDPRALIRFCDRTEPDRAAARLERMLNALDVDRRVHLVGISAGGLTSAAFADRMPEYVRSLTLIAPLGMREPYDALENKIKTAPVLGDLLHQWLEQPRCEEEVEAAIESLPAPDARFAPYERERIYRHINDRLAEAAQNVTTRAALGLFEEVARSPRPMQILWGMDDEIAPYPGKTFFETYFNEARLVPIEDAGHEIAYTRAVEVATVIAGFVDNEETRTRSRGMGGKPRGPLARLEAGRCGSC